MYLKFHVKGQTLVRADELTIAAGSKNYLYARFRFSAEWSGLVKTAVFTSADGSLRYHMLIVDGECAVPYEIVQAGGFYVSVFAGDRLTSTRVFVSVAEGTAEESLTPPDPSSNIYDQITTMIQDINSSVNDLLLRFSNEYVTTAMLVDGCVTNTKLGSSSVSAEKIADNSVTEEKLGSSVRDKLNKIGDLSQLTTERKNTLVAAINEIDRYVFGTSAVSGYDDPSDLSEYWGGSSYGFHVSVGTPFYIYVDEISGNRMTASYLEAADDYGYDLSQSITVGGTYMFVLTSNIVSGAEPANGTISITPISEVLTTPTMIERVTSLENTVGTVNQVLEELLSNGT